MDTVKISEHRTASAEITLSGPEFVMSLYHLFHGERFHGRTISVILPSFRQQPVSSCDSPQPESRADKDDSEALKYVADRRGHQHHCKIFIGGLHPKSEPKALRGYFSQFGSIKDCGIVKDFNGISRRFGFCEFWNDDAVVRVLSVPQHVLDGATIGVRSYCLRQ